MSTEALVQLCVVRIGRESYALDLKRIDEILPVPGLTPLPRAPKFLEGVVRLRGDVLPVVDARKRLQVESTAGQAVTPSGKPRRTERMMVCRVGRRRIGVLVDAVTSVRRVPKTALRPAPLATPHVLGVTGEGDAVTLLLDVKALLTEDAG
ncbi:MAG: purine-binding chemotaxis protein CheW [Archangium sp.]|nr:purine-binding chemotaxis protein CheW [Archangium sp.]